MKLKRALVLFLGVFLLTMVGAATVHPGVSASTGTPIYVPIIAHNYPCYSVEIHSLGNVTEYRLRCADQHFLTVIHEDGLVVLRPHPGRDVNGWGSSWYAQPYLLDTSAAESVIENVTVYPDHIRVSTSGQISNGAAGDYGTWEMTLELAYSSTDRKVSGTGTYRVALDGDLTSVGDLKLYKIASSYLTNVPLLSGGHGNTGDMSEVIVTLNDGSGVPWIPVRDHCPQNSAISLSIDVRGQYNNVDTAAQGYQPIEPAYKPGLKVILEQTHPPGAGMMFCGFYYSALGQAFWVDNVAVHAIVRPETLHTEYKYNVTFESEAMEDECERPSTCAGLR